jgi:nicotinamidase-related amidase
MNSALILIDIQNDYFKGGKSELYNTEQSAKNARSVLDVFREKGLPIFHVQHINIREGATFFLPDSEGVDIHNSVYPIKGEQIIIKHTPNSFFETQLQHQLSEKNIENLVVCGMMSHMCVDTTVRAAKDLGYLVTLLHDACTTKDLLWDNTVINAQLVHNTFMASLNGAFAKVQSTGDYISESTFKS